jgi:carboxymethylenebutenolidase
MAGFSDPAAGIYNPLFDTTNILIALLLADALEARLKNAKEVNIYRYPEQGHAFLNADAWGVNVRKELGFLEKDKDAIVEEKDIRDQAWGRIFNFFTKHLSSE